MVELLIPDVENVNKINRIWKGNATSDDFIIDILGKSVSIEAEIGIDFEEIRCEEELLNVVFNELNENSSITVMQTAVLLLDGIYHTRLQSPIRFANAIYDRVKKENLLEEIRNAKRDDEIIKCVDAIATADIGYNYAYSFATKFCNRINKKQFPIFDSYVAGLLWNYQNIEPYKEHLGEHFNQASMGKYRSFLEKYRKFAKAFSLEAFDYKEIDIFMWTYGKVLSWRKDEKSGIDCLDIRISPQYIPEYN